MPEVVEISELDSRPAVLLLGLAFSFLLKKEPDERSSPATRMQQVRHLLKRLPALAAQLIRPRRELSLELTRLLRQGPDRYSVSALRELQGLVK